MLLKHAITQTRKSQEHIPQYSDSDYELCTEFLTLAMKEVDQKNQLGELVFLELENLILVSNVIDGIISLEAYHNTLTSDEEKLPLEELKLRKQNMPENILKYFNNALKILGILLTTGAPDDGSQDNILYRAVLTGSPGYVRQLLIAGADVDVKDDNDDDDESPLELACQPETGNLHPEIVARLVSHKLKLAGKPVNKDNVEKEILSHMESDNEATNKAILSRQIDGIVAECHKIAKEDRGTLARIITSPFFYIPALALTAVVAGAAIGFGLAFFGGIGFMITAGIAANVGIAAAIGLGAFAITATVVTATYQLVNWGLSKRNPSFNETNEEQTSQIYGTDNAGKATVEEDADNGNGVDLEPSKEVVDTPPKPGGQG